MKKVRLLFFLVPLFSVVLFFSNCWATPIPGDIDPYQVTLFRDVDYSIPVGSWKLNPNMRMLRVPQIEGIPFSVLLGSKVGILLFPGPNFSNSGLMAFGIDKAYLNYDPEEYGKFLLYLRFVNSAPIMFSGVSGNDKLSLIIYRKDMDGVLGVCIESGATLPTGQFYPLPDSPGDSKITYNQIPYGVLPFSVSVVVGGGVMKQAISNPGQDKWKGQATSFSPSSLANFYVTITSAITTVTFPDTSTPKTFYDLGKYGVGQISSIQMDRIPPGTILPRVNAPPSGPDTRYATQPKDYSASAAQKSGPALTARLIIPTVSGQWKSNIGLVYNITQQGNQFGWTVANRDEKGEGTLQGNSISASWRGPQGGGSSQGKITTVDANGKATKIDWNNGVQFYR